MERNLLTVADVELFIGQCRRRIDYLKFLWPAVDRAKHEELLARLLETKEFLARRGR